MKTVLVCIGLCVGLAACSDPAEPPRTSADPLGAHSGHSFSYLKPDGEADTAVLAGIRAIDDERAQQALNDLLVEAGEGLVLEPAETARDRYGRQRVYAWFPTGQSQTYLDAAMIDAGYAMVWPRPGADARVRLLYAMEVDARAALKGGWSDGTLEVRDPDPNRLAQRLDSGQIVEGRVVSTGQARNGRLYLNFGLNWRTDFTVSLSRAQREAFEAYSGIDPATLEGAVIRVRGWLYDENGPMISLSHPAQIELVDAPVGRGLP